MLLGPDGTAPCKEAESSALRFDNAAFIYRDWIKRIFHVISGKCQNEPHIKW